MRIVVVDDQYSVSENGTIYSNGVPLKPRPNQKGYFRVVYNRKDEYIHRLVWSAFNGPIPPGLQVRHLNGDPSDNRLSNLAIGTQSDNEMDKRRHGTDPRGERHGSCRLSLEEVLLIRELWVSGVSARGIKSRLNLPVSEGNVHAVATGISWRHVPLTKTRPGHIKGRT